ncbi:MAG: hypothetical protein WBF77_06995 [Sulfurimonadaceae bacterium]
MNKTDNGIIASMLAIALLTGCSGMTHGFDEESALYSKPTSEKELQKVDETPTSSEKEIKKVDESPETKVKEQELDQENETTISYDPNEGE